MNRLTAIGLASLAAYGLLIASKYTGIVSAARQDAPQQVAMADAVESREARVQPLKEEAAPHALAYLPKPIPRAEPNRMSAVALEFRAARDLKAYADALNARRGELSGDERYHLAKALEECQFVMNISDDLAAHSARQKRQFLATLPAGDTLNPKRIAAYEAVDNTQRCLGFQNAKISQKDIDDLMRAAALQGDPRAQARLVTNEIGKSNGSSANRNPIENAQTARQPADDLGRLIGLLETHDPEAMLIVGEYLSRQSANLRVGPNGETPEPSAFLGGFSLVACDVGLDCSQFHRDPIQACAYGGYCNAQNFEELYQNFLASPWAYTQAQRYRALIHTAIRDRNWSLIGITPKLVNRDTVSQ